MPDRSFFNKYPYTDFHELNLDWIVDKTEDCVEAVDEMNTRVTAAEADIDTIQESAIMDATMLDDAYRVTQHSDDVQLSFTKKTYTNGNLSIQDSDSLTIPARTDSLAGVMLPGDKAKLDVFTVDGSDVSFPGDISAAGDVTAGGDLSVTGDAVFGGSVSVPNAPTAGSDAVNKTYADSLALTGATVTEEDAIGEDGTDWTTEAADLTIDTDHTSFTAFVYGALKQYEGRFDMDGAEGYPTITVPAETILGTCIISPSINTSAYRPTRPNVEFECECMVVNKAYHVTYPKVIGELYPGGTIKLKLNEAIEDVKVKSISIYFFIPAML